MYITHLITDTNTHYHPEFHYLNVPCYNGVIFYVFFLRRIKNIIQDAAKLTRHSQRRNLTTKDVDYTLKMKNYEVRCLQYDFLQYSVSEPREVIIS